MEEELISVVIPAYNKPEMLANTLQSVLRQTHKNLEIIVVDDGSEIDLLSIIEQFKDVRISYFKLKHKNANVARNYGIQQSKGQYVAMLDADDEWLENHLKNCLITIQKEKSDGLHGSLIIKEYNSDNQS
ncbi:MAG: glycosyltransferase family 2 protein, partial [Bacteroidales bacterium]|nr:glycosyltransferase family 2 protein [Bacteroidales bacterium]